MFRSVIFGKGAPLPFWERLCYTEIQTIRVKYVLKQVAHSLPTRYFDHNVGLSAAALAYYLVFALFPLLVFVSALLGTLQLDVAAISGALLAVFPRAVAELMGSYLDYVTRTSSGTVLGFSFVFSVYFPMRATKCLMWAVRQAYGLPKPDRPLHHLVRRLLYTVVLFVAIGLILAVAVMGPRMLSAAAQLLPGRFVLPVSDFLLRLWRWMRFLLLAVVMFSALGALYALSQDKRQRPACIIPGAVTALAGWLTVSAGFSFYVEHFASYSVVYGGLGTVIVLLVWLYLTAAILILGAELNAALTALGHRP